MLVWERQAPTHGSWNRQLQCAVFFAGDLISFPFPLNLQLEIPQYKSLLGQKISELGECFVTLLTCNHRQPKLASLQTAVENLNEL